MILGQVLKKVIVGALVLACFQRAKGVVDNDVLKAEVYWEGKIACMSKEFESRKEFFDRAESFMCEEEPSDAFSFGLMHGRIHLLAIEEQLKDFVKSAEDILHMLKKQIDFSVFDRSQLKDFLLNIFDQEVNKVYSSLRNSFASVLDKCDAVSDEIKRFDSHMLGVIEQCSDSMPGAKIQELTIFKLAKMNKPFAASIVYNLFGKGPFERKYDAKQTISSMFAEVREHLLVSDFIPYNNALLRGIEKGETNLLLLADRHFHLLFSKYGVEADVMDIYLSLAKENISEEEISQHRDITPGQVMKVIIMESVLCRDFMGHRTNVLFSNLGKVIENIAKPAGNSENIHVHIEAAGKKQDKILDALNVLWNGNEVFGEKLRIENIKAFCAQNSISYLDFKTLQNNFVNARWMYRLDPLSFASENITSEHRKFREMHFDMTYTHPMYFIYQRYRSAIRQSEDISRLVNAMHQDRKPFAETDSNDVAKIRLYRISKTDSDLVQRINIKSCIKAWYSKYIEIAARKEDYTLNFNILTRFCTAFTKSQYVTDAKIKLEETSEPRANESNPLQDDRMEVDDFELVEMPDSQ
ncbi:hypothetical protein NEMIN01_1544 [Nematocida minor]|uniref:uncharacterized protein n=1 Tax=Nematocida minor TaxID=1912983 RepID=UPI0022205D0B|nr:uncharacterized protein NEMIN01_1544 [Nematocida minor]KAI5191518.1 hypothetical protein NEMIN01_1544 [Nematocida minor]